uniref:Uncharacterized protein n=1 Tax=viral metagenome TaxID=1070528 RepID=A0A6M3LNQ5_9ZZZZ
MDIYQALSGLSYSLFSAFLTIALVGLFILAVIGLVVVFFYSYEWLTEQIDKLY